MLAPSITYWNRLEPRSRSNDLGIALAACVRDPAWFLARQWQLGELSGEDAGSPAYVRIAAEIAPAGGWSIAGGTVQPLDPAVPVERAVTQEPFADDDLSTSVELGEVFSMLLQRHGLPLRDLYLAEYPIGDAPGDDDATARLRAIWRGRTIDGLALYRAARDSLPSLPPPAIPPVQEAEARSALEELVAWVEDVFGSFGDSDPPAWVPHRLDYTLRIHAAGPSGTVTTLRADPDEQGELEWHAFDVTPDPPPGGFTPPAVQLVQRTVIPGPVKFKGMPSARFWDFEDGEVSFAAAAPDRRDLATLALLDFMLVHGNDWFVVPFDQPVGSLCRATVTVVDVFGEAFTVPRAGAGATGARWSMYTTTAGTDVADFFHLPASAAAAVQDGPAIEEVRFLRDDVANLVWAVELATANRLGQPRPGDERTPPPPPASAGPALRYRLQTGVPAHWIPFEPVAVDATGEQIVLERAALLAADGPPELPQPWGKVLRPQAVGAGPYRLREEEVPREGTHVARVVRRSRWIDGSTHIWVSRRRSTGTGEGWSGLRFDVAEADEGGGEG